MLPQPLGPLDYLVFGTFVTAIALVTAFVFVIRRPT